MAGTDLTNNHTKQEQETNQIRTQEAGTHNTHDRGLTLPFRHFNQIMF